MTAKKPTSAKGAESARQYAPARKRNLNQELLDAMKAPWHELIGNVTVMDDQGRLIHSPIARTRIRTGLTQSRFAELLGVSVRTLQQWEQGRREPNGAAKTLLKIAERNPKLLLEAAGL